MQIQNIDMSVPVGQGTADPQEQAAVEVAADEAALGNLIAVTLEAMRERTRFAWTAQSRSRRRDQFEREIKSIVKRLASSSASVISDRNGRAEVRVRLYADLSSLAGAVIAEIDHREARVRLLRKCAWIGAVGLVIAGAVAGFALGLLR